MSNILYLKHTRRAITASQTIRLWDLSNGVCLAVFDRHSSRVEDLTVINGERYALSVDIGGTTVLWDLKKIGCLAKFEQRVDSITTFKEKYVVVACKFKFYLFRQ